MVINFKASATRALFILAVLALVASGCGNDEDGGSEGAEELPTVMATTSMDLPTVMATTSIWADVVDNVTCEGLADIVTLIPPGGDPHAFQPSLQDRGRMDAAAMIVANGLDLEEGLLDTIEAVEESGTPVFHMTDHVQTIGFSPGMELEHGHGEDHHEDEGEDHEDGDHHHGDEGEHHDEDGEEHHEDGDHHHEGDDPHIWFDPVKVAGAIPALSEALGAVADLDADALSKCGDEYREELVSLDAEIKNILEPVPSEKRLLVTNHDALGYFANRYGFTLLGTVIPGGSSLGTVNPAALQELVDVVEQTGVTAIFAESTHSSQDAEALGREAGVKVIVLDTGSLGPEGSDSSTYVDFMLTNAKKIAEALG